MSQEKKPDLQWDDTEIVLTEMSPDTKFLFERMTIATLEVVSAHPGEEILDLACGRGVDAFQIALKGAETFGLEPSDKMIKKAFEWLEPGKSHPVIFFRALAEKIPFPDQSLDKLVCKGAIDHFFDLDASLKEMARTLKPNGRLIISVANFESLSCKLAKIYDWLYEKRNGKRRTDKPSYIPPDDHNYKFDYQFLIKSLKNYFVIEKIWGVSLLWCFPGWGAFLQKLSPKSQKTILEFLDFWARVFPRLADVLVVRAKVKNESYKSG